MRLSYLLLLPILTVGWLAPSSPLREEFKRTNVPVGGIFADHGIIDSRAFHDPMTGLFRPMAPVEPPTAGPVQKGIRLRMEGQKVVIERAIGMVGFYAGPHVHIIDVYAVADPLLSHLPPHGKSFHIAHFGRQLPQGYVESIAADKNLITDPRVRKLYDQIALITRGRIFDKARLIAIIRMNTFVNNY